MLMWKLKENVEMDYVSWVRILKIEKNEINANEEIYLFCKISAS